MFGVEWLDQNANIITAISTTVLAVIGLITLYRHLKKDSPSYTLRSNPPDVDSQCTELILQVINPSREPVLISQIIVKKPYDLKIGSPDGLERRNGYGEVVGYNAVLGEELDVSLLIPPNGEQTFLFLASLDNMSLKTNTMVSISLLVSETSRQTMHKAKAVKHTIPQLKACKPSGESSSSITTTPPLSHPL